MILPAEDLPPALWRHPASPVARAWAALPENEEENVAAQIESVLKGAALRLLPGGHMALPEAPDAVAAPGEGFVGA